MFAEDFDAFFDTESGVAVEAQFGGNPIAVIFDEPHGVTSGYEDDISDTRPQAMCKVSDVHGVAQGSSISVKKVGDTGYTTFTVADVQPDGTGLVTLILQNG